MSRWSVGFFLCLLAGATLANPTRDLQLAARSGDLKEVRRLIESGIPIDASDDWGTTSLSLAAKNGQMDVVRFLLDNGADPSSRETFFGMSVLDMALWTGAPDYQVARLLLAAGARDRASALSTGLESDDVALARAAAESGPVPESEAADLRARYGSVEGALAEILAGLKTEPDPPPPGYSAEQLAAFAGRFEGGEASASVEIDDGGLVLDFDGKRTSLAVAADRLFRNDETGVTVRYFGRAGTVEGISVERQGKEPARMRVGDSPVARAADLPELEVEPVTEPTVHWPGFRGANRDGVGDGVDTPVEFDLESGDGVAWSVDG